MTTTEEEEEEEILADWQLSGLVLLQCFFMPVGVLFIMKILKDERHIVIKAYKFAVFEILRGCLLSCIVCLHYIPTYRVYRLYDYSRQTYRHLLASWAQFHLHFPGLHHHTCHMS